AGAAALELSGAHTGSAAIRCLRDALGASAARVVHDRARLPALWPARARDRDRLHDAPDDVAPDRRTIRVPTPADLRTRWHDLVRALRRDRAVASSDVAAVRHGCLPQLTPLSGRRRPSTPVRPIQRRRLMDSITPAKRTLLDDAGSVDDRSLVLS